MLHVLSHISFISSYFFLSSIRAVYGKDICKNAVHGSSNMDKAGHVIEELFPEVELLPSGRTTGRNVSYIAQLLLHDTIQYGVYCTIVSARCYKARWLLHDSLCTLLYNTVFVARECLHDAIQHGVYCTIVSARVRW